MTELNIIVTFPSIAGGDLEEFRKHAAAATEIADTEEGTLSYAYYFSADETRCVLLEAYASSEAVLVHMGNVMEHLGPLAELGGGMQVDVLGEPSAELLEAGAAFSPRVHHRFQPA